ncbi:hypothetical protein UFOVP1058_36 [uncultured Caudovirales phage]|uniref:Uncharacterized protein n=1 Tax=uncultured Caudovirales phage TaxID=2100421 RepID=A0A6J5RUR2_9CAUD|nr:hypothetical protein UFOVP656_44 [uncultured Caudovirales phage]CAB4167921.1 hypothetical protein UFOVP857_66 [uncultured Caudovirales phage]CAB4168480.1 hypothetical protein UFOVP879_49 [uncultured Caudovirales phage]CAB4181429.1 hypothetical protein UFOVP1058_36 [uncultured Caudovirales phage]CAB4196035.1 hypothetical protein UFOVP1289_60 [uncultured Caudovirales phage]
MDSVTQIVLNVILGIAAFFGAWTLTGLRRAIERLDADTRELPEKYVLRVDYRADIAELKTMLEKIMLKLDRKADK